METVYSKGIIPLLYVREGYPQRKIMTNPLPLPPPSLGPRISISEESHTRNANFHTGWFASGNSRISTWTIDTVNFERGLT